MWQDYDKAAYTAAQQQQEAARQQQQADQQRRAYEEQTRLFQEQQVAASRQAEQYRNASSTGNGSSYQPDSSSSYQSGYGRYHEPPEFRLGLLGRAGAGSWNWMRLLRAYPNVSIWKSCLRWIGIVVLFALSIAFWVLQVVLWIVQVAFVLIRSFAAGFSGR